MNIGNPGKYGEVCKMVRETTEAEGVALIVFNGKSGTDFEFQVPAGIVFELPDILEFMAKGIREDLEKTLKGKF